MTWTSFSSFQESQVITISNKRSADISSKWKEMSNRLQRIFWWLWSSLFATVVSLIVLQSMTLAIPSILSSGWALQSLMQSQLVLEPNDLDLEMQPLEHAGPQRRNLTVWQALRLAFHHYRRGWVRNQCKFVPWLEILWNSEKEAMNSPNLQLATQKHSARHQFAFLNVNTGIDWLEDQGFPIEVHLNMAFSKLPKNAVYIRRRPPTETISKTAEAPVAADRTQLKTVKVHQPKRVISSSYSCTRIVPVFPPIEASIELAPREKPN